MPKAPENDTSGEVEDSSLLATDDKQESCATSNSAHIEVPVGSLTVPDTSVENQSDEQQTGSQRFGAEEVSQMGRDATVIAQNVAGDNNDNISEKQLNLMNRQDEPADETITNMSVQVRSGAHVSVACGEGTEHVPNQAKGVENKANIKPTSPIFQYSSDAAATGLCGTASIFCKMIKVPVIMCTFCCTCFC